MAHNALGIGRRGSWGGVHQDPGHDADEDANDYDDDSVERRWLTLAARLVPCPGGTEQRLAEEDAISELSKFSKERVATIAHHRKDAGQSGGGQSGRKPLDQSQQSKVNLQTAPEQSEGNLQTAPEQSEGNLQTAPKESWCQPKTDPNGTWQRQPWCQPAADSREAWTGWITYRSAHWPQGNGGS